MLLALLSFLIVGVIAGYITNTLKHRDRSNLTQDLMLGCVGSIVGGLAAGLLQIRSSGMIGSIIIAVLGAFLAEFIYNKLH